jgi:hypothetical protein
MVVDVVEIHVTFHEPLLTTKLTQLTQQRTDPYFHRRAEHKVGPVQLINTRWITGPPSDQASPKQVPTFIPGGPTINFASDFKVLELSMSVMRIWRCLDHLHPIHFQLEHPQRSTPVFNIHQYLRMSKQTKHLQAMPTNEWAHMAAESNLAVYLACPPCSKATTRETSLGRPALPPIIGLQSCKIEQHSNTLYLAG